MCEGLNLCIISASWTIRQAEVNLRDLREQKIICITGGVQLMIVESVERDREMERRRDTRRVALWRHPRVCDVSFQLVTPASNIAGGPLAVQQTFNNL